MLVWISNKHADELQRYAELTGVSIGTLVDEALDDHIECVISSRSEALAERAAEA